MYHEIEYARLSAPDKVAPSPGMELVITVTEDRAPERSLRRVREVMFVITQYSQT
jgi:hypothetical protein